MTLGSQQGHIKHWMFTTLENLALAIFRVDCESGFGSMCIVPTTAKFAKMFGNHKDLMQPSPWKPKPYRVLSAVKQDIRNNCCLIEETNKILLVN